MKALLLAFLSACFVSTVATAPTADFSGTWEFNASQSKNIGMMASAQITSTITQTAKELIESQESAMGGQKHTHVTTYDLSGKTVPNDSPMGDHSQTSSKWSGNKLVTTWESEGAVAGTKVIRTETRYLSDDGKTMFLESSRGNNSPMVIVFDRK